jgi:hypothetical protein
MVFTKDKGRLVFIMTMVFALVIWVHGYIFWKGGISLQALKIHAYTFPVSAFFTVLAFGIYRSLNLRFVISDTGLLVEDFSRIELPWTVICSASIKIQYMPRGATIEWLVLHTKNDGAYAGRTIRRVNKLVGVHGIPVCNLATYKVDRQLILEEINRRARGCEDIT